VKPWQLFHGHIQSEARPSIAMKERLRFAIREGGKIGGAGVVTKIKA
jgi:translation elongation factor EF-Tu-like GTPase